VRVCVSRMLARMTLSQCMCIIRNAVIRPRRILNSSLFPCGSYRAPLSTHHRQLSSAAVSKRVYVGLGSNLGNRKENLQKAVSYLNASGVTVARTSSLYVLRSHCVCVRACVSVAVSVSAPTLAVVSPFSFVNLWYRIIF
jgi:hypothetical protein